MCVPIFFIWPILPHVSLVNVPKNVITAGVLLFPSHTLLTTTVVIFARLYVAPSSLPTAVVIQTRGHIIYW